jgi:hypothetical protein
VRHVTIADGTGSSSGCVIATFAALPPASARDTCVSTYHGALANRSSGDGASAPLHCFAIVRHGRSIVRVSLI